MTTETQVLEFEVTAEGTTLTDIWTSDPNAPEPSGMDAAVWADCFCKMYPRSGANRELMETWFSNAIMAGYDEAMRKYGPPSDALF